MIAICPNPYRDTELELTLKLRSLLEENGFTVGVFPVFSDPVEPAIPEGIETRDISYLPRDTTLVIIVGGDGTTLAVARNLKYKDLPLLCVNLGTKGFMASLAPEDPELKDKIIFKKKSDVPLWEIKENVECHDCHNKGRGYRIVEWGKYDRSQDSNPQYRCKDCSINKMKIVENKK